MPKISKIIILVFVVLLFGALGFGILTEAGSGDNASGFAWGETTGWVSFNSTNCDSDGNGITDTGNFAQCPVGDAISDYGVNIDGNGKLSGYAWSEHIGWITFNESDLSGCPQGTCRAKINPPGQLGNSDVDIEGWARALAYAGGWDGWLKFDHGESNEPYIDVNGDWHGWAWGSDVVGWISFDGTDPDAGGAYNVTLGGVNNPPSASGLGVVKGDYCATPAHYFSWTYTDPNGDDESQFQFQVDNNSDFSSPEIDRTQTGTWSSGDSNNQTVIVTISPVPANRLGYNTTYYWRVKVWDEGGATSVFSLVTSQLFMAERVNQLGLGLLKMAIQPVPMTKIQPFNLQLSGRPRETKLSLVLLIQMVFIVRILNILMFK